MHRWLLAGWLFCIPAAAHADSPGPDTVTPCKGKDAGALTAQVEVSCETPTKTTPRLACGS